MGYHLGSEHAVGIDHDASGRHASTTRATAARATATLLATHAAATLLTAHATAALLTTHTTATHATLSLGTQWDALHRHQHADRQSKQAPGTRAEQQSGPRREGVCKPGVGSSHECTLETDQANRGSLR